MQGTKKVRKWFLHELIDKQGRQKSVTRGEAWSNLKITGETFNFALVVKFLHGHNELCALTMAKNWRM